MSGTALLSSLPDRANSSSLEVARPFTSFLSVCPRSVRKIGLFWPGGLLRCSAPTEGFATACGWRPLVWVVSAWQPWRHDLLPHRHECRWRRDKGTKERYTPISLPAFDFFLLFFSLLFLIVHSEYSFTLRTKNRFKWRSFHIMHNTYQNKTQRRGKKVFKCETKQQEIYSVKLKCTHLKTH